MSWRLILRDALSVDASNRATYVGELDDVSGRTISEGVRRMATFTGTLPITSPLVDELHQTRHRLLVVRDGRYDETVDPLFVGIIVSAQETRAGVAFTAADPFWRLTKRLIGKALLATTIGKSYGTAGAQIGKDEMLRQVVQDVNEDFTFDLSSAYYSGVSPPLAASLPVPGSGISYAGPYVWKQASDVIQEIASNIDAPEWIIAPVDPRVYVPAAGDVRLYFDGVSGTWQPASQHPGIELGRMVLANPIGGVQRPAAEFVVGGEHGNASDYNRISTADGIMDHAAHLPTDPNTQSVIWRERAGWIDSPYDVPYEDIVTSELTVDAMRQQLLDEHLAVRNVARETITFDALADLDAGSVPTYMTRPSGGVTADYYLGDIIPFRVIRDGVTVRDVLMRVYGATRTLSDEGTEVVAPMLTPS